MRAVHATRSGGSLPGQVAAGAVRRRTQYKLIELTHPGVSARKVDLKTIILDVERRLHRRAMIAWRKEYGVSSVHSIERG